MTKVDDIVQEAWIMAEDYDEGDVIVQYTKDDEFVISHQVGNSFPDLGDGFQDSKDRIILSLDCRYYDKQYYEGEEETEENRLTPFDYEEAYTELVDEAEAEIERLKQVEVEA